jgi:phage recombination protein Bet
MEMLFESVNGHAVPVIVPDREPDGVALFTLNQASAHFGIEPDVLTRMFRASWGRYLGADDPATDPVTCVSTAGTFIDTVENTIQDVKLALLKQIKYPEMAVEHFEYCISVCRQRGLSPWADQVFFDVEHDTHRGLPVPKVIVGIHGLRLIADRTGERDGNEPPTWEKDEAGNDVACTVTIYRFSNGRRCAYHATARMAEYHPGQGMDPVWDKLPTQCLRRCAEAAALREAFVEELGGLYSVEEMAQARNRDRQRTARRSAGSR